MNILFVEPFYTGSHKSFADQLKKYSTHDITLLTLEGKFWKWRMYGAAMTLAQQYVDAHLAPDLIVVTDMLDLPTFLSGIRQVLPSTTKVISYFHENQLTYPWQADSKDKQLQRDLHYGMMNYHTAYASDSILFNSNYNMDTFYAALSTLLDRMPDHKHTSILNALQNKSYVMHLGLELNAIKQTEPTKSHDRPLILWNHRWEHDKNPELFFKGLKHLQAQKIPFDLAILGESYKRMPTCFQEAQSDFEDELIHYGFADYERYIELLNTADILPVTSNHEFFGISVMEAIFCGATPLLPNRISYPELYDPLTNPEIFYDSDQDFIFQLAVLARSWQGRKHYNHLATSYDWHSRQPYYDEFFNRHR